MKKLKIIIKILTQWKIRFCTERTIWIEEAIYTNNLVTNKSDYVFILKLTNKKTKKRFCLVYNNKKENLELIKID